MSSYISERDRLKLTQKRASDKCLKQRAYLPKYVLAAVPRLKIETRMEVMAKPFPMIWLDLISIVISESDRGLLQSEGLNYGRRRVRANQGGMTGLKGTSAFKTPLASMIIRGNVEAN